MSPTRRIGEADPNRGTAPEVITPGRYEGLVAVVTGAGSGIGRATSRRLAAEGAAVACLDLSDGGLLAAVAEMAMTGGRGAVLDPIPSALPSNAYFFGEDQARYIVETADPDTVLELARAASVPAHVVGAVSGVALTLPGSGAISVDALRAANEAWLPDYMAQA